MLSPIIPRTLSILCVILLCTCVSSCNTVEVVEPQKVDQLESTQIRIIPSYITANSISSLSEKAALIVSGRVINQELTLNLARDPDNISLPAANLYGIGQIYSFEVKEILKGEPAETGGMRLNIVQFEGLVPKTNSPTEKEIQEAKSIEEFLPFQINGEYILFLEPVIGFDSQERYFTGVAQPWRFFISQNCVYPESLWQGSAYLFQAQPLEEFIERVKGIIDDSQIDISGYPAPNLNNLNGCPLLDQGLVPYP